MRTLRLPFHAVVVAGLFCASHVFAGSVLYVSNSDPSCSGVSPCYATVQSAIDVATPGDVVRVLDGSYAERIRISGKTHLTVEGHPDHAPGSVSIRPALQPSLADCLLGAAVVDIDQSSNVTFRRIVVHGFEANGIRVRDSSGIRIVGTRIVANGRPECGAGVLIEGGSSETLLAHNLVHANRRDGVVLATIPPPPPRLTTSGPTRSMETQGTVS